MHEIYVGQKLVCVNGDVVIVKKITHDEIIVEYKTKLYRRPKSIIGQKLFFEEANKEGKPETGEKLFKTPTEKKQPISTKSMKIGKRKFTCKDCMVYKREDCFGEQELCDRFRKVPVADKTITDNWPKIGTATYYRIKNSRKRRY